MKLISHRGNINGRIPEQENHPSYILSAVSDGYDVEVDVWFQDEKFFLGHDYPVYPIDVEWLIRYPLWCHAKNSKALHQMLKHGLHCFWHQTDDFTLTSNGIVWCYMGKFINGGITVVTETPLCTVLPSEILGICTDYPQQWKMWLSR